MRYQITDGPSRLKDYYEKYLLDYENTFYVTSDQSTVQPPSQQSPSVQTPNVQPPNAQLPNIQPPKKPPAHAESSNIMQGPPVPMPEFNPPPLVESTPTRSKSPPPPPPLPLPPARTSSPVLPVPPPPPPPPPMDSKASNSMPSHHTAGEKEKKTGEMETDKAENSKNRAGPPSEDKVDDKVEKSSNKDKRFHPMDIESTTSQQTSDRNIESSDVVDKNLEKDGVPAAAKASENDTRSNDLDLAIDEPPSNDVSEFLRDSSDGDNNESLSAADDKKTNERKAQSNDNGTALVTAAMQPSSMKSPNVDTEGRASPKDQLVGAI